MPKKILSQTKKKLLKRNQQPWKPKPKNNQTPKKKKLKRVKLNFELKKNKKK